MANTKGKVVLITGASSGIGEGTARVLAANGARVVLGARRIDKLKGVGEDLAAAGGEVRVRALDVTDLEDVKAFVAFAEAEFGPIDVLVNNAGVMPLSPLLALKIDEWNWMIDVNIRGVLHGIAAVLPKMDTQGYGHIVNISSVGGFVVQPTAAVYAATKFAVRAISEGLRKESNKVRCTCVYPGVVESELAETISDQTARDQMKSYRKTAIGSAAIGHAILYAIEQPGDVDVNNCRTTARDASLSSSYISKQLLCGTYSIIGRTASRCEPKTHLGLLVIEATLKGQGTFERRISAQAEPSRSPLR